MSLIRLKLFVDKNISVRIGGMLKRANKVSPLPHRKRGANFVKSSKDGRGLEFSNFKECSDQKGVNKFSRATALIKKERETT